MPLRALTIVLHEISALVSGRMLTRLYAGLLLCTGLSRLCNCRVRRWAVLSGRITKSPAPNTVAGRKGESP